MSVHVVLVGPPGAGKTTVGQALAGRLGVEFADTDEMIERETGRSIPDIFIEDGEEGFRAIEHRIVTEALVSHDGVLALGGGAPIHEATHSALQDHPVVFLDVDLTHAVRRVGLNAPRPLLMGNTRARFRQLAAERHPLYESAANWTIDTSGLEIEAVVDLVISALEERNGS